MQIAERLPELRLVGGRWLQAAARYEPWVVLAPLVVVQWLALLAFVLTVRHNGWLFYQGGDETFYYTTSWMLSGWHLPTTPIGFGWSYLLTPLALFIGPNILAALPGIVLLNTLVLLPISTLCVYGIASRIGGRLLGYLAGVIWVVAPYLAIPFWDPRYHQKWTELFLPQALGLTNLGDFPSTVCLLVAAYFCFRALDHDDVREALVAGLATGFGVAIKPANALFLAAPVLAFLLARRWRQLVVAGVAAAPALVALAVWKSRGLGYNPALGLGGGQLAYLGVVAPPLAIANPFTKYVHVDWQMLSQNMDTLREFFWSVRPLEYLPIAGAVAVAFRSLPKSAFLTSWFFAYFFIKGSSGQARVEDGSFFRLMMPSFPAYLLLAVSIPVLVPTFGREVAERLPPSSFRRLGNRRLVAAAAVFALVPLLIVLAIRPMRAPAAVKVFPDGVFLPIDHGFRPTVSVRGGAVSLAWPARGGPSVRVFYRVIRAPAEVPDPETAANPPIVDGVKCQRRSGSAASDCSLYGTSVIHSTFGRTFVDLPGRGRWTYYVATASNWLADPNFGDILLLSAPVSVEVGK
jgi:Dolichyl-phosphate-mannose-protein mannosyltransferase